MQRAVRRFKNTLLFGGGTFLRALGFVVLWIVLMVPAIKFVEFLNHGDETSAWARLGYEVGPMLATLAATWLICRRGRKVKYPKLTRSPRNDMVLGFIVAIVWLGVSVGALMMLGRLSFTVHKIESLSVIWILAATCNVIMQEYLVRGYLYDLVATRHSAWLAVICTTVIFVALHGFGGGVLGFLNVTAASLLFSILLIKTKSLLAPIIAHTVWNVFGGIIIGAISLGGVYPSLMNAEWNGNDALTGGALGIEGSAVTLIVTSTLIAVGLIMNGMRRRGQSRLTEE